MIIRTYNLYLQLNPLVQSVFGEDQDQRGAHSQPHERSRNDASVHYSIHKPINTEFVELVNGEALSMHNIEYTSDQMDLDNGEVPDPLYLQPMPTWTSDGPDLGQARMRVSVEPSP